MNQHDPSSAVVTALTKSEPHAGSSGAPKNEIDPLIAYLNGERGHELASRLIAVIESIKHSTIDKSASHAMVEKYVQVIVILAVVICTSLLVYVGKFEASVGVLFGTLVGYVFGKK